MASHHSHSHSNRPGYSAPHEHNLEKIPPPWVSAFRQSYPNKPASGNDNLKPTSFTLSTVSVLNYTHPINGEKKIVYRPHARIVMFRGFAFSPNSGILTVTTDRRMPKFEQLASKTTEGTFEGCFYFPEKFHQFRISGTSKLVYLKAPEYNGEQVPNLDLANAKVVVYDAQTETETDADHGVIDEFNKAWDALSPGMKLTFTKPPPGSEFTPEAFEQLEKVEEKTQKVLGGEELDLKLIQEGRSNFVLILLIPEVVDFVDVTGAGRRVLFTRRSEYEWIFHEVCP
ncbi:pyridoxamine 5'-phosphate oxidase-domain-containing protein [Lipomyces japonicus]|uniref:pyridoxamine 5'-phosphate oxidase-domain-containing protein n=1 Tax=Lipomyces japonicus TaxID=56871 RepID=UPI0034CF00B4